ncbi:MAG: DUF58 domain-containing protein [Candidatus Marinimicrobia bacterium]|nr:DUF58 domain-containing protein [Candidatus Neomarinimicrobiota bacterium]MBL7023003.1 DUF58 domain-containing protein [Candidatus Neomarinimicrobiota bacterium]MBL7110054.1 DUF58 domain-containing protein [Candidatus Neomarinimicrobiota bacterium]
MLPVDILKKVKLIEIKTRRLVNNIFGGEYHSAFKGMGMEFAEVREYQPGDDVRNIDWNVTARMGKPFIKKFDEERELTVMLMVDVSASGYFGTGDFLKSDVMVEIASILSFSAIKNNDKVGLLLFSDQIEKYVPPKKGKSHVFKIIRELIYYEAEDRKTDIPLAIEYTLKMLKRRSVVFLISDFIDEYYKKPLQLINQKHDLVCIRLTDNAEKNIPNVGLTKIHDVESQTYHWIDTSSDKLRNKMQLQIKSKLNNQSSFFKKHQIDFIPIQTNRSYVEPLVDFFNKRTSRK